MAGRSHSINTLFDRAPELFWTGADAIEAPETPAPVKVLTPVVEMPAPPKTLRGYLSDVDYIADTVESLDDEAITEQARGELGAMLVAAIAGTKEKIDSSCRVLAMWEGLEAAAKAERERLDKREKKFRRLRERLERYLIDTLDARQAKRMDGATNSIEIRLNPDKVVIDDASHITHEFMRYPEPPPPEPDKVAIKAALKAGRVVVGCRLTREKRLVRS